MDAEEILTTIRSTWLTKVSSQLTSLDMVKEILLEQLNSFYDLVIDSIQTQDTEQLQEFIKNWIYSGTETKFDEHGSNITTIIINMFLITYETLTEQVENNRLIPLLNQLLPVYAKIIKLTTDIETYYYVQQVTDELENVRINIEKLEKSKSDFISVAAHELRTPLTLIEGYSSMMIDIVHLNYNREQSITFLNGIKSGIARLKELIDDMIDVSLIDNNLLSLSFQPIWIIRLLNIAKQEFSKTLEQRQLLLTIHPFPGCDEMIFGDGERLYQAFCNIISNAIKYTPNSGQINIYGRTLPGFIETIISDTGIGIDPDDYSRIFEKFGHLGSVSSHSSGKTTFMGGGPGLGLPITKGIIEAHGGAIWVESDGHDEVRCPGSSFHVLLPLRKTPPDDKAAKLFRPLIEEHNK